MLQVLPQVTGGWVFIIVSHSPVNWYFWCRFRVRERTKLLNTVNRTCELNLPVLEMHSYTLLYIDSFNHDVSMVTHFNRTHAIRERHTPSVISRTKNLYHGKYWVFNGHKWFAIQIPRVFRNTSLDLHNPVCSTPHRAVRSVGTWYIML